MRHARVRGGSSSGQGDMVRVCLALVCLLSLALAAAGQTTPNDREQRFMRFLKAYWQARLAEQNNSTTSPPAPSTSSAATTTAPFVLLPARQTRQRQDSFGLTQLVAARHTGTLPTQPRRRQPVHSSTPAPSTTVPTVKPTAKDDKKKWNDEVLAVQQRSVRHLNAAQKQSIQDARRRAFIERLDRSVARFMRQYRIEGVSVAIAVPKGVKVERAYGWANTERRQRMHESHMLRVASLTKPITSAAILRLVEAGRLRLDERVFGPGGVLGTLFGTRPYGQYVRMITVKHMLEHSAGWPSNPAAIDPVMQHVTLSREQLIGWVLDHLPLSKPPGTAFQYSNFCYIVLGRVIEARSGMEYEKFVRAAVLEPCNANNMTNQQLLPGREPMYYSSQESPYTFPLQRADSALGWVSTAGDYLRFVLCIDGWPQVPDVISNNSVKVMTTPSAVHDAYGLGWSFNHMHDWWHSGSMPGSTAYVEKYRTGLMWVILSNRRHEHQLSGEQSDADAHGSLLQFERDLSHVINRQLF